jgi:hypothetical protein
MNSSMPMADRTSLVVSAFQSSSGVPVASATRSIALKSLVIGNAAYMSISPLKKPINDAQRMADVLRGMKFEVILGTDVTKLGMEDMAQKFRAEIKGADAGFFFCSDHGFQTSRVDQQHPLNHLGPVDFKVQVGVTRGFSPVNVDVQQMPAAKKGPRQGTNGTLDRVCNGPRQCRIRGR